MDDHERDEHLKAISALVTELDKNVAVLVEGSTKDIKTLTDRIDQLRLIVYGLIVSIGGELIAIIHLLWVGK